MIFIRSIFFQHLVFWHLNFKRFVVSADRSIATSCPQERLKDMDVANYGRHEGACGP